MLDPSPSLPARTSLHRVVILVLMFLPGWQASGQILFPGTSVDGDFFVSGAALLPVQGGEAATNWSTPGSTLTVTGDASTTAVRSFGSLTLAGSVRFDVGSIPVEIEPKLFINYKAVNGGGISGATGGTDAAILSTRPRFEVYSLDRATNAVILLPELQYRQEFDENQVVGNGLIILGDEIDDLPNYILGAGLSYEVRLLAEVVIDLRDVGPGVPPTSITLEAGRASNFAGLRAELNARVVPEPASAAVVGAAGVLLLRRRSRCLA